MEVKQVRTKCKRETPPYQKQQTLVTLMVNILDQMLKIETILMKPKTEIQ